MKGLFGSLILIGVLAGCGSSQNNELGTSLDILDRIDEVASLRDGLNEIQIGVLEGAERQLVSPAVYDASYQSMDYPNGDVDPGKGACTDVVIRALRNVGIDLQKEIYEDAAGGGYPRIAQRDRNIDHRRCPNQRVWMRKNFEVVKDGVWEPGDIVFWTLSNGRDHVGIVSDKMVGGRWKMIHNISGVKMELVSEKWVVEEIFRAVSESG